MSRAALSLLAIVWWSSACLDPIVGAECAEGFAACDGVCVDTSADRDHCGGCGVVCRGTCIDGLCDVVLATAGDEPMGPDAGLGTQPPDATAEVDPLPLVCGADEQACNGSCVVTSSDPEHCGRCGHRCTSGLCSAGECLGQAPGQVILVGHDYTTGGVAMRRLLGNAVFLADREEVRVAEYRGSASAASTTGVAYALERAAADFGRSMTTFLVDTDTLPGSLSRADVLLIYPQHGGTSDGLISLGGAWRDGLVAFLDRGGVVVSLDAPAAHRGTYQILVGAGVIEISGRAEITSSSVSVTAPGDALAVRVPLLYAVTEHTVSFESSDGYPVVADGSAPVVLRKLWL